MSESIATAAIQLWRENPLLALTYPDFTSFEQVFRACRGGAAANNLLPQAYSEWVGAEQKRGGRRLLLATRPDEYTGPLPLCAERLGGRLVLWLYGPIRLGDVRAHGGIRDKFCSALKDNQDAQAVIVRIDSPGGCVESATSMANELLQHPGRKVSIVDRSCWSSANLVAAVSDKVFVRRSATMMLHGSWAGVCGNARELARRAEECRKTDYLMARFIAGRRRLRGEKILELMRGERFMGAVESVALGLADACVPDLSLHEARCNQKHHEI